MAKPIIYDEPVVLNDTFWSKVNKNTDSGCWLWTAYVATNGYGQFGYKGSAKSTHRLTYIEKFGNPPEELQLDHLCRVRHCVNPDHLEPVTNKENALRGIGITAINAKKTHCIYGHEFTESNIYYAPGRPKRRNCLICKKERRKESYLRKKI